MKYTIKIQKISRKINFALYKFLPCSNPINLYKYMSEKVSETLYNDLNNAFFIN